MIQRHITLMYVVLIVSTELSVTPMVGYSAEPQVTFYVSPAGSDANPGTDAKPFATIEKARQVVRAVNKEMTGDIVIVLHGGTYQIDRTIVFDPDDSGNRGHNVIYRAPAGEDPTISGGKQITGWQPHEKGRWKAPAPLDDFRQLYVNGTRATRARGEAPAGIELAYDDGYTTTAVDMVNWRNPADIEFVQAVAFTHTRCKVAGICPEGDRARIAMLQPHFTHARTKEPAILLPESLRIGKPDYMENALELLDEPGEWYLDRLAKTVYYMPRQGEDMTKADVIAPAVETLVELRGTLDRPVQNIRFEGITFEHASWLLPNKIGFIDTQANFLLDWKNPMKREGGLISLHNQSVKSPSNIVCHAAKSIRFERCTFTKLGGGGIDLEFGAQDNVISGCHFYDISGTAVQVGDVLENDHHPKDPRMIVKNNAVVNNCIHNVCVEYMGGVGVFAGYTEGTVIAHNEITRLPYSAIAVGWGWGEEDAGGGNPGYYMPFKYDTPTPAKNNRIEFNHIHRVMQEMADGGAIYTLGNMPGTVIRGNHVHDNPVGPGDGFVRGNPGGIYLDEGSGFIEVVGNVVYDVRKPMNYNNYAQDRNKTCNEHNNFFGSKPDEAKPIVERAGLETEYRDLTKKPRQPIAYIDSVIPTVKLPAYDGERHEAVVPDTLDLAERATLAVNGLTGPLDPAADYELYWRACFRHNPPIMAHDFNDHVQVKFHEALPLMRLISGSRQNDEVDRRWMEVVLQMQGPDGLLYYSLKGRPWAKKEVYLDQTGGRGPSGDHYTEPFANGRLLGAIALYYKTTGDDRWKEAGKRIVDGLTKQAVHRDNYAFFSPALFGVNEVCDANASLPEPWTGVTCGWVAIGLAQFYNVTGYEPALALSGKLARFTRDHCGVFEPDGRYEGIDMHFHGHLHPLLGMLEYGVAAHDKEMIQFVRKGYEFGVKNMNPIVGYVPETISPKATSEICGVADMIALAVKLSLAGAGDYWDDVDRWTRNQFAEGQLTSTDWVKDMMKDMPANADPVGPDATTDRVPERCVGGFAGWPSANDWQQDNPGTFVYPGSSIMHCCTGNGTRAIYYVWENILQCKDGKLRVNLLLNRASPWADVDSFIPYEGRVDVKIKKTSELLVRIPEWGKPEETKCQVNGTNRPLSWDGRYAVAGKVEPKDVVTMTFPIFERTDSVNIQGNEYTLIRKGNDVVHIDPPGKYCPLYQRDKYRENKARMRSIQRFVVDQQIDW